MRVFSITPSVYRDDVKTRQVIALDGYFIKALIRSGIERKNIPKWVQTSIDAWMGFDAKLPITAQVKFLVLAYVQGIYPFTTKD